MKILNIIQRYPPAIGGSEFWCRGITQFLSAKGLVSQVSTINLNNIEEFFKKPPLEQEYSRLGRYEYDDSVLVTRYKLWSFAGSNISNKISDLLLLKFKLDRTELGNIFKHSPHSFEMYLSLFSSIRDADLVHLYSLPYFHNVAGYHIAKLLGKTVIITPFFHPGNPHYEKKLFYRLMGNCDAVIAVSNFEKEYLTAKGIKVDKIYVTGCFIDAKIGPVVSAQGLQDYRKSLFKEHHIDEDARKVIFIGRKGISKGIDLLIDALNRLAAESAKQICLFIVGSDAEDFSERRLKDPVNNRLRIIDFGAVFEIEKTKLLQLSDLLVLPSEFESFGIVFLEAWRQNKPVIGTDRGAMPEILEGAGLCSKYGDVSDLKNKIKLLLSDKGLAEKLGKAGNEKLKTKYSLESAGNSVVNICNKLKKRNKILIVSQLFPPHFIGGSEIVAYNQSLQLKAKGFKVKVFAGKLDNSMKQYRVSKENKNLEVTRINLHDIDFDRNSANFEKKIVEEEFSRLIYKFSPDIVHFHNIYSLSMKMIDECRKLHIRSVMTLHDYWGVCFKNTFIADDGSICGKLGQECLNCQNKFFKQPVAFDDIGQRNRLFREYLNSIDLLISPSRFLRNRFVDCGILPEKIRVIDYGIDTARFRFSEKTKSVKLKVGYIGQIASHKGIENLLKGVSLLNTKDRKQMSLTLFGSGEPEFVKYCRRLVTELKIGDIVNFAGKVKNEKINEAFRKIDVLVVSSVWPENSPVTILEALAAGTPVIASNIGGIPELVEDGVNGYLYPHDNPSLLAADISKFIRDRSLAERMREGCISKAKGHELSDQVDIITGHYARLLN